MRIRPIFAIIFVSLATAAAYLGFAEIKFTNDKALHFFTFLILTIAFYWILDASRRRCINATVVVCGGASLISEFLQSYLPWRGGFDSYDVVANLAGTSLALLACAWYHKRLLDRRREARHKLLRGEADAEGLEHDVEAQVEEPVELQQIAPEPIESKA